MVHASSLSSGTGWFFLSTRYCHTSARAGYGPGLERCVPETNEIGGYTFERVLAAQPCAAIGVVRAGNLRAEFHFGTGEFERPFAGDRSSGDLCVDALAVGSAKFE
jgi:hypothetical protein